LRLALLSLTHFRKRIALPGRRRPARRGLLRLSRTSHERQQANERNKTRHDY
jgi:hypothetical protein